MKSSKNFIAVILIVVLVVATSLMLYVKNNRAATQYRSAAIERGNITATVNATGTVNAVTTVQVGSQVSGTIAKLGADFNSAVKKGQIIVQLDSTFLSTQVHAALANEEKAAAAATDAKCNLDRTPKLFHDNLVPEADRDAALTAYESAEAGVKQAQAALESAETNLRYSTIRSPIDGIVISRNIDVGQTVAASLQAPTLFTIANDLRKMEVETNIDEADIGKIHEGQHATFTVDAYPDLPFDGVVTQIRLAPIIQQNVVTYNVVISVDNPELKLKPGLTANVSILVDRRENVLKIPNAALRFHPGFTPMENGISKRMAPASRSAALTNTSRATVWIFSAEGKPKPAPIQTGITDGSFTELVAGELREGEQVITGAPLQTATPTSAPGMPVGGSRFRM
jgi:HlyD family secretion protein